MAPSIAGAWRDFWHTMTSYDRHASVNSPFRTGQHVPLPQTRHAPLTSIATSAGESSIDLSQDADSNGFGIQKDPRSPQSPYSPGMRSSQSRQSTEQRTKSPEAVVSTGEIQMQNFSDGLPPPPPVSHSWKRIDRWAEDHYEELLDNLCEGCTQNDVNELEHELDCSLPMDVRESLQLHDGQERGGLPTGILFGCMLLDCEEIVQEWNNWRKVNEEFLSNPDSHYTTPTLPSKAFGSIPTVASSSQAAPSEQARKSGFWKQDLIARQDSQPPNAVQKAYAHPSWIPLARDWGGNCIAVDLAPGTMGRYGQVIIFGRDFDCKYVIARSWATFLASVADDLNSGDKVIIDEDTGELKLKVPSKDNVQPPYLDILRWRCDRRYGRRSPRRRGPLRINSNVNGSPTNYAMSAASPYASPSSLPPMSAATDPGPERGRSPHRFPNKPAAKQASPRGLVSSPLARVAEEAPAPIRVQTDRLPSKMDKLISVDTPRPSDEFPTPTNTSAKAGLNGADKENRKGSVGGLAARSVSMETVGTAGKLGTTEEMKTVEI